MTRSRQMDPGFASMEDVMAAAGASERTIRNWMDRGLVPVPTKVSLGYPNGVFNRFPAHACEQVRFIAAMRAVKHGIPWRPSQQGKRRQK